MQYTCTAMILKVNTSPDSDTYHMHDDFTLINGSIVTLCLIYPNPMNTAIIASTVLLVYRGMFSSAGCDVARAELTRHQ